MTISNTSAASPTSNTVNSAQKQWILFGPTSGSQTSATFTVDQAPFYLSAFNLAANDFVSVEQVYGIGSGELAGPFAPVFGQLQLSINQTSLLIDYPGRYRLVHTGPTELGMFTVLGAPMVTTSDGLSGIAESLSQVVNEIIINPTANNFTYKDLGTITSGVVEIDFTQARAQKMLLNSGGLTDIEIHALPLTPGFVIIKVQQPSGGGEQIQFATLWTSGLKNAGGVIPAQAANASTIYIVFYDGDVSWLVGYMSDNFEKGAYTGESNEVLCGDNTARLVSQAVVSDPNYGAVSGTDTYAVTVPALPANSGATMVLKFTNANTGASTLNVNAAGAAALQRHGAALTAGQIPANSVLSVARVGSVYEIVGA